MSEREYHIKRFYLDDDPDSGVWIDIVRLDKVTVSEHSTLDWQESVWEYDWKNFDDKKARKKRITSAEGGDEFIDVPIREEVSVSHFVGSSHSQEDIYTFDNSKNTQSRETLIRRVYHRDIPDRYLDAQKQPPKNPKLYADSLIGSGKEFGNYLDVELIVQYGTFQATETTNLRRNTQQEKAWEPIQINALVGRDLPLAGDPYPYPVERNHSGVPPRIDPPWRLDPLQNIVNVSWGIAVIFGPMGLDAPAPAR